jgi:hypothetical protein
MATSKSDSEVAVATRSAPPSNWPNQVIREIASAVRAMPDTADNDDGRRNAELEESDPPCNDASRAVEN